MPGNPHGEEFRKQFKLRTGYDSFSESLPQSELEVEDRIGASMSAAGIRLCTEYHPKTLPITPPEGRVELDSRARMSRLVKKVALLFGAEMVRITKVDQRWVYRDVDIPHKYAIIISVSHKPNLNMTAPS